MKIGKGTIREIFAGLKTKNGRKQLYAKYRALPVIISWILSVTFAFVTNRTVVFRSTEKRASGVLREAASFYAARLATLFVDLVIMFLLVDLTGIQNSWYELGCKLFSNVIILILNYVLSKLLVFRKKAGNERKDN